MAVQIAHADKQQRAEAHKHAQELLKALNHAVDKISDRELDSLLAREMDGSFEGDMFRSEPQALR